MKIKIVIDVLHRIKTSALHTALHIALMAALTLKENLTSRIMGCHIDTEKLELISFAKINSHQWYFKINEVASNLITENIPIERYLYENKNEAWIWKCKNFECPCGGTHLQSTGQIKNIKIKRKNVGKQ